MKICNKYQKNVDAIYVTFEEDFGIIFSETFFETCLKYSQHFIIPTNFSLKIFIFYAKIS